MNRELYLRMEISRLEQEWHQLLQPSPLGFTVNNYHRWPLSKLSYVVDLQDTLAAYKRELWKLRLKRWFRFITNGHEHI